MFESFGDGDAFSFHATKGVSMPQFKLTRSVLPAQGMSFFVKLSLILMALIAFGVMAIYYDGVTYNAGYRDGMAAQRGIDDSLILSYKNKLDTRSQDFKQRAQAAITFSLLDLSRNESVRAKPVFGPRDAYPCKSPRNKRLRKDLRNWGYCYRDGYWGRR